jgi:carboxyl-terminal processing protease
MPDIFVPIDTTAYSDYYRDLIRKGIINKFVLEYMDNNRKVLDKKYISDKKGNGFDVFMKDFQVDDAFMKELTDFGVDEGLEFNEEEFEVSKEHLRVNMKAYIARDLWDVSEFFEIINELDPIFNEALKVIQDDALYKAKLKSIK